jgi:hypothetical protein
MAGPRIYADFQNLDDANRLRLNSAGTLDDLSRLGIELCEGLELTLYTDDGDKEGNANEAEKCWVAAIDWTKLRHASEEALPPANGTNGQVIQVLSSNPRLEKR